MFGLTIKNQFQEVRLKIQVSPKYLILQKTQNSSKPLAREFMGYPLVLHNGYYIIMTLW